MQVFLARPAHQADVGQGDFALDFVLHGLEVLFQSVAYVHDA